MKINVVDLVLVLSDCGHMICLPATFKLDFLPFGGGVLSSPCVVVPTMHAEDPEELSGFSSSSITVPSLKELKSAKIIKSYIKPL